MIKYSDTHCMVCGLEIAENELSTRCKRCGFPFPALIGGSEEEIENAKKNAALYAQDYRSKYWTSAKIYLEVYNHAVDNNGGVRTLGAEDIFLAETKDFREGEIKWHGEKFARLTGNITLKVSYGHDGEKRNVITLAVENPSITDFWNAGVKYEGKDMYRIAIGTPQKFSLSEAFECV